MAAVAAAVLVLPAAPALAQTTAGFPNQTVRIVVGVGPGGLLDIFPRLLAPILQQKLGQPVIVENRVGSGGIIAGRSVAEAKPDGHTLFGASAGSLPAALLHNPPPYTLASFAPVARTFEGGSFIGVRGGLGVTSFKELVAYGKANPGKLRFGSSGVGSPTHLGLQLMADLAGFEMTHIPYRGNMQALQALLQNEIDLTIVNAQGFEKQIGAGEIRLVAWTARGKAVNYPDVQSLNDLVPGYEAPFWLGFLAPAGTPPEIVNALNAAVNEALVVDLVKEQAAKTGLFSNPTTPQDFARYVKEDTDRWAAVIKAHNIKAE